MDPRPGGCPQRARQKGGGLVGPNPTDRGKGGSKQHLITDHDGIPLGLTLTAASEHDSIQFEGLIAALPAVKQPFGYRRKRPDKVHADKGYDYPRCRRFLAQRGILVRIARRGIESKQHLGKHRWAVERTFAWLTAFRRLTIRYERRADIHVAFLTLACAIICLRRLLDRL